MKIQLCILLGVSFFWNGQTNVLTGQVRDVIKKHFVIEISTMVEANISVSVSAEQMGMFILICGSRDSRVFGALLVPITPGYGM